MAIEESQQRNTSYRNTTRYVYDDEDDTTEWAVNHRNSNNNSTNLSNGTTSTSTSSSHDNSNNDINASSNSWSGGMFSHTDDMDEDDWADEEEGMDDREGVVVDGVEVVECHSNSNGDDGVSAWRSNVSRDSESKNDESVTI